VIEAGIFVLILLALVGGGFIAWRLVRGPAPSGFATTGRIAILGLLAAPLLLTSLWCLSRSQSHQIFGEIVPRVETSTLVVALTFDDGPTADWTDEVLAADEITARVLEGVRPGPIILMHVMYDGRVESRQALPDIIRGLEAKGYQFSTVSELLAVQ
jgi:peptidoglycan/xylan/chitin deacetylase (PgdA/CDA1 family)